MEHPTEKLENGTTFISNNNSENENCVPEKFRYEVKLPEYSKKSRKGFNFLRTPAFFKLLIQ